MLCKFMPPLHARLMRRHGAKPAAGWLNKGKITRPFYRIDEAHGRDSEDSAVGWELFLEETTYRGYRIRYHCVQEWFAHIYPPRSVAIMKDGGTVLASKGEGKDVLLERACARIDREENGIG